MFERLWGWSFAIAIAGIIIVTFSIADTKELPMTIIGAVLGVAMTVFATFFLFKGQSKQQLAMINQQREQEKDVEIFKQKLKAYQEFLNALRKYVTETTESHKKEVIFHSMAIRMHSKAEVADALDSHIIKLLKEAGTDKEVNALIESLNSIACIFGEELYKEPTGSTRNLEAFAEAISGSQEEPSEAEKLIEAAEEEKEDDKAVKESSVIGWNEKIAALKLQGWILSPGNDAFTLSSPSSEVVISVYRKKGKYVVEATKEGDSGYSQKLKDTFKGARRYGTWWRELPINNYGVTEGTLLTQLPTNDRARASVIKWIDKLIEQINNLNK